MKEYTTYDSEGNITSFGSVIDETFDVIKQNQNAIEGIYSADEYYIDTLMFVAVQKTDFSLTGIQSNIVENVSFTITNIPANTTVIVAGNEFYYTEVIDDSDLEISFDAEGEYVISFDHLKHKKLFHTITVTEAV